MHNMFSYALILELFCNFLAKSCFNKAHQQRFFRYFITKQSKNHVNQFHSREFFVV